jgi:hypothetical protein
LDDIYQPLHGANAFGRNAVKMIVLSVQPELCLFVVAANECVERPVNTKEKKCQFAFLARWVKSAIGAQPGNGGFTRSQHCGQISATEAESFSRGKNSRSQHD